MRHLISQMNEINKDEYEGMKSTHKPVGLYIYHESKESHIVIDNTQGTMDEFPYSNKQDAVNKLFALNDELAS